jgi:hypothetical protein
LHAIDLFLLDQPLKAFDGVLGVGLFLNHQLNPAPGDATAGVELLDRPLRGSEPALAGARGDP